MPIEQRDETTFLERVDFVEQIDARVTFGGFDAARFAPNINFSCWAESGVELVFFNINRTSVINTGQPLSFDGSTVRFESSATEHDLFYQAPDKSLKWDIELLAKPASNIFQWAIAHDGVTPYYQPALTQQELDEGHERPEHIVGSYALYVVGPSARTQQVVHKSGRYIADGAVYVRKWPGTKDLRLIKRPRRSFREAIAARLAGRTPVIAAGTAGTAEWVRELDVGDTVANWRSGKIAHITRPWIEDADGVGVWGQLDITGSTLSVTVPQAFLDTARYPVTVDPSFGYPEAGTPATAFTVSRAIAHSLNPTPFSAAGTETVTSQSAYLRLPGSPGELRMAVYDHNGSIPVNRLAASAAVTGPTSVAAWHDTDPLSLALAAATDYISAIGDATGDSVNAYYDSGGGANAYRANTNSTTLTDPWTETGGGSLVWGLYTTYSIGGGGVDVDVPTHALTLTANAPAVAGGASVSPPTHAFTLTANAPAVAGGVAITVPTHAFTVAPVAPAVAGGASAQPPAHAFALSPQAPAVAGGASVVVPVHGYTLAAFAPGLITGVNVAVPTAALSLTAYAPTVVADQPGSGANVIVPTHAFTLTANAPAVASGVAVDLPSHAYALNAFAPAVAGGASVSVPAHSYTVNTFAPAVVTGAGVDAPTHAFNFNAYPPTVVSGVNVQVPTHAYTLRLIPPYVNEDHRHHWYWMPPRLYGVRPMEVECTYDVYHDVELSVALDAVDAYRPELEADVVRRIGEV